MIRSTYNSVHPINKGNYILINSLSGAVDVVDSSVKERLDQIEQKNPQQDNPDEQELLSFFIKRGYVFNSLAEERQILFRVKDAMDKMTAKSKWGMTFNVCTTYACNLRCPYCYQGHQIHDFSHALDSDEITKMFEAISNIIKMEEARGRFIGAQHRMVLYGGEPLLPKTKDSVKEIVDRAVNEYGFRMCAITNGTFLHQFMDIFQPYHEHWDFFQISLDGPQAVHDKRRIMAGGQGTYDRIVQNIDMALERGFAVAARTNVNKENLGHLTELANFIEYKGWNTQPHFGWQVTPVTNHFSEPMPDHLPEHELLIALYEMFGDLDSFIDKYNARLGSVINMRTSRIRNTIRSFDWSRMNDMDTCTSSGVTSVPHFKECSAREQRFYSFGTEGLIYACPDSVGRAETAIGTFFPEYKLNSEAHQQWDRGITDSKECTECSISLFCGGGCAYANLMRNGDITKPYCNYANETIEAYLRYNKHLFEALGTV
ncbi:radical SAM protein [Paenibacillus sp. FSL R7-0204]|uniref:radical SAM/SPASM domain-containing protein n=1 Tax=Paenibacillus sp. FSL R7-0204 TaxID=2921675 RepID=UPI0030F8D43A